MKKGPGRPRKYPHGVVVLTITMPRDVFDEFERIRKEKSMSRGELIAYLVGKVAQKT